MNWLIDYAEGLGSGIAICVAFSIVAGRRAARKLRAQGVGALDLSKFVVKGD